MSRLTCIALASYILIFLAFYPPICGIEDEQGFVNQAIFWSRGAISAEGAGLSIHLGDLLPINGRHLPIRHPGRSLLALPFYIIGGYQALFLSGILIHTLIVLLASATLRRMHLPQNLALLVLFHPTLLIYSRTITADAAAGLGLLLSVYALANPERPSLRDIALAGLGVGLAATMRHHAAAAAPALALAIYWRTGKLQDIGRFALACFISALPLFCFNLAAYGTLLDPFSAGRGIFSLKYLAEQIPFYAESLSLFWPLMFIAPLFCLYPEKSAIAAICLTFLAMLGCYYFHDSSPSRIQTDIIGLRLMQVALPAWIIGYAALLNRIGNKLLKYPNQFNKTLNIIAILSGITLTLAIFSRHQSRLIDYAQRRETLLKATSSGGFLLTEGLVNKLVGIYRPDQPEYEVHQVTFQSNRSYNESELQSRLNSSTPVYMIFSPNAAGQAPSEIFQQLKDRLKAIPLETGNPQMLVWKVPK
jgi:hypothetical protein